GARVTSRLAVYRGPSYRRRLIDADLESVKARFAGRVLDVGGGRRRGRFSAPADVHWVVADVSPAGRPDVRADVQALPFRDAAFDAIQITEVLEHVPHTGAAPRGPRAVASRARGAASSRPPRSSSTCTATLTPTPATRISCGGACWPRAGSRPIR